MLIKEGSCSLSIVDLFRYLSKEAAEKVDEIKAFLIYWFMRFKGL